MAEQSLQTRTNHARIDPAFHYALMPGLIAILVWTIIDLVRYPTSVTASLVAIVILLVLTAFKARTYALKVQDRVIRLEERLRLASVLPEPLRTRVSQMKEHQLIALRFAPDSELAGLVEQTLDNDLSGKQIKESIKGWRGDYWRV